MKHREAAEALPRSLAEIKLAFGEDYEEMKLVEEEEQKNTRTSAFLAINKHSPHGAKVFLPSRKVISPFSCICGGKAGLY